MPAKQETYRVQVRGMLAPRHTLLDGQGRPLGTLQVRRNRWGLTVAAEYQPEKGERLTLQRDPGLQRAQFTLWTEGREWLGSSLRWHPGRRQIDVWTGSKPLRMVPRTGFARGWRILAPRTGELARIVAPLVGRGCTIERLRKIDPELLIFCYFLGSLSLGESLWPTALDAQPREAGAGRTGTSASTGG